MRWVGHVSRTTDSGAAHRVLVGRHEGKEPLGGLKHTWEDRFQMDRQEVGWGYDFIYALFMMEAMPHSPHTSS